MTMGWSVVFDGFLVCVAENIRVAGSRRYQLCYSHFSTETYVEGFHWRHHFQEFYSSILGKNQGRMYF